MIGKILRRIFTLIIFLILISAGIAYLQYKQNIEYIFTLETPQIIDFPRGSTIQSLNQSLKAYGYNNQWVLPLYGRLTGKAQRLQAGTYLLEPNTTLKAFIDKIEQGDVIRLEIRIIEGTRSTQLLEQLKNTPYLTHELTGKTEAEIAKLLNIDGSLEGQFLPNTYQHHYGESDLNLLKRMHQALNDTLEQAWQNRAENSNQIKTPYEALILASIIEKETALHSEREQISGVFHRRLQKNMRLQTDPTVIYGMGERYQGTIYRSDLERDTPYNTYTRHGLPPTPIALASKASIEAALHPDQGQSLYFVADGKGGHTFSNTYQEHQKAVAQYRKLQRKQ